MSAAEVLCGERRRKPLSGKRDLSLQVEAAPTLALGAVARVLWVATVLRWVTAETEDIIQLLVQMLLMLAVAGGVVTEHLEDLVVQEVAAMDKVLVGDALM